LRDILGNLEPSIAIYPSRLGPVVRNAADDERGVANPLWGMPTPDERVKGKADYGTTNIGNHLSSHWQQHVGIENRCVVPATSFAEPSQGDDALRGCAPWDCPTTPCQAQG
jgi:putative SOS response-associated peptidase YedK